MRDERVAESLWGGIIWGDCVGRLHRGWQPETMDALLGEQFFIDLITPTRTETDWLPTLRAVEPVQRRAYVEVGLPGHSIQLAMMTASIIADDYASEFLPKLETAMSEDVFRMPNSELLETMHRLCRADKAVDARFGCLFFPSLMYLCLDERRPVHDTLLKAFRPFVSTFEAIINGWVPAATFEPLRQQLLTRLASLFPDRKSAPEEVLSSLLSSLNTSETPAAFWQSARILLHQMPYVGNVIGLIGVFTFGMDAIVPWHRIKGPNALETLVSNRPLSFDVLVAKERERTNLECLRREEFLAERRAVLNKTYR
ncbi:MAG: hypothetical protein ACPGQS_07005 [Bradymonadia bacterium]